MRPGAKGAGTIFKEIVMSTRLKLAAALAAVHLALVTCGACHVWPLSPRSSAGRLLSTYGALSGASDGYRYFAPGVASQTRVTYTLRDVDGAEQDLPPLATRNPEVMHRHSSMNIVWRRPHVRSVAASSLAGHLWAEHPEAEEIVVHVQMCDLPTMKSYRAGKRPRWRTFYQAAFVRAEDEDDFTEEN
jgi:hypothetical protein